MLELKLYRMYRLVFGEGRLYLNDISHYPKLEGSFPEDIKLGASDEGVTVFYPRATRKTQFFGWIEKGGSPTCEAIISIDLGMDVLTTKVQL